MLLHDAGHGHLARCRHQSVDRRWLVETRIAEECFVIIQSTAEAERGADPGQVHGAGDLAVRLKKLHDGPRVLHVLGDDPVPDEADVVEDVFRLGNDFAPVFGRRIPGIDSDDAIARSARLRIGISRRMIAARESGRR